MKGKMKNTAHLYLYLPNFKIQRHLSITFKQTWSVNALCGGELEAFLAERF